MKNYYIYIILTALTILLFNSCRKLPSPLELELTFRVINTEETPMQEAYVYFSVNETAEEIAAKIETNGLGYPGAILRPTSSQGMLSLYPLVDFKGIEEDTEIHFYIRSQQVGTTFLDNLETTNSFVLKKLKAKAYFIEVVLQ